MKRAAAILEWLALGHPWPDQAGLHVHVRIAPVARRIRAAEEDVSITASAVARARGFSSLAAGIRLDACRKMGEEDRPGPPWLRQDADERLVRGADHTVIFRPTRTNCFAFVLLKYALGNTEGMRAIRFPKRQSEVRNPTRDSSGCGPRSLGRF